MSIAALREWAYEKEMAERREFYAALGMFRRIKPDHAPMTMTRQQRRKPRGLPGVPGWPRRPHTEPGKLSDLG